MEIQSQTDGVVEGVLSCPFLDAERTSLALGLRKEEISH